MSDRDPLLFIQQDSPSMHHNKHLNPTASSYAPSCSNVHLLGEIRNTFSMPIDALERGDGPVAVDPSPEQDAAESRRIALKLKQELEELNREGHKSGDNIANIEKTKASVPPHLRAAGTGAEYFPPHLRAKAANGIRPSQNVIPANSRLVTDGPIDNLTKAAIPSSMLSPPASPAMAVQQDVPIEKLSLTDVWKPHFLTNLAPLELATKIPASLVTFHPQFLEEILGGTDWSPGLKFIVPGPGTCILKNRSYFLLDPSTEPYLPARPGQHGAKLTAFFNENPEAVHGDMFDGVTSYENVPMFVEVPGSGRYMYFGNYSQTRWSDRLDMDTMTNRVPQHVKEFWATELTSAIRPQWVTEELKKHFFRKPEYDGRMFAAQEADTATVTSEEEVKLNERMEKDVRRYVEELRDWEREASMKTAMIKKEFILDAFKAADADEPPALRLWWEYLECVDWRHDFYNLLVTLQSREARFSK
ncbi:hypothetical protein ACEQ8H_002923 [Pleosporales sp. CAS-2024a]